MCHGDLCQTKAPPWSPVTEADVECDSWALDMPVATTRERQMTGLRTCKTATQQAVDIVFLTPRYRRIYKRAVQCL